MPECRRWYERLAKKWKLVRYDNRGEGLSDRQVIGRSLEASVSDLEAVVDRLGLDRFVLFGPWYGGPPAIAYAGRHPQRVSHLILWCTFAQGSEWLRQPQLQAARSLVDKDWVVYTEAVAQVMLGWSEGEPARRYAALLRESVTPEFVENYYSQMNNWDVSGLLPAISTPTLVLHRRQHSLGLDVPRGLAAGIRNSRLVLLDGDSTAPYLGDTESVVAAIDEFLASSVEAAPAGLSGREVEVLRLVAGGRSNREIGKELTISLNTVDRHVSNILTKIGATNRAEAASFAVRHRLA
jgi:pimeloyl-ACP methyl ester carboxylesterase/DNA-binding CsgD family transcriptional regulator